MPDDRAPDWDDVFFAAALEPERWVEALRTLADHTRSTHGQIIGVGGERGISFNIANDFPPALTEDFIALGGGSPGLNYRIAASRAGMAVGNYDGVLYEKHYQAVLSELESDRYVRWCEDIDIPFGCQTNLVVDNAGLVGFALLRSRKDGPTTPAERAMFAAAAGAARRAVRLQERLEGDQARLLAGAFDAIRASAFVIDRQGRVQAMTEGAERIVADGRVALRDRRLDADGLPFTLGRAVASLVGDPGLDHVQLRVDGAADAPPLFLEGFRLPPRAFSLGALPAAIVLAKTPGGDRAGVATFLGALYRLTAAEADIAMRLHDGATRPEIAATRGVTAETLRGQIKTICAKTGVHREADLARLMAAIMA